MRHRTVTPLLRAVYRGIARAAGWLIDRLKNQIGGVVHLAVAEPPVAEPLCDVDELKGSFRTSG